MMLVSAMSTNVPFQSARQYEQMEGRRKRGSKEEEIVEEAVSRSRTAKGSPRLVVRMTRD